MYIFVQKNILLISIVIIEVGNGSRHTPRSIWFIKENTMSKEQALEELLKMIKEGNITDYDAELASYRDEKYGYKDIDENTQRVNNKE